MTIKYNIDKDMIIRIAVLSIIVAYIAITYPGLEPFPQMTALLMSWLLSFYLADIPLNQGRYMILTQDDRYYGLFVSPECSGILVMLVFLIVIFITPGIKLRHRFYSIVFLPLLFMANAIRVVSGVIFADLTTTKNLSIYHSSVGQLLIFLFMIGFYITFLKMFGYLDKNKMNKDQINIEQ